MTKLQKNQLSTEINTSLGKADNALGSSDIGTTIQAHSSILDNTTASYTTADETKLDGIKAGAEVNEVTLIGSQALTNKDLSSTTNTFPAALEDIKDITPTKGDLLAYNGTNWVDVGVGTNDQILTADSTEAAGVKWADASGGGGDGYFETLYVSTKQYLAGGTTYTFTHNLGLTSGDVSDGRYKVIVCGSGCQWGDAGGLGSSWGSSHNSYFTYVWHLWSTGTPGTYQVRHSANSFKIKTGSNMFATVILQKIY